MTNNISSEPSRIWATKADDSWMSCYLGMQHRITLRELVDHFAEHYPHVDPLTLSLNFTTVKWSEPPTEADLAARAANRARNAERHEAWQRKAYAELKAKFEPSAVAMHVQWSDSETS